MRIRELRLTRYGRFTDQTLALPARDRDVHLLVGPNEAGKSTAREALGDWLFGIPMRTKMAFKHPMSELRLGGVLERPDPQGGVPARLDFDRTKGNKSTLRTPEGGALPDDALRPWLGTLQRQEFELMYALDREALVAGGKGILSASNHLGRMLFQSASGIDHLGDVLRRLQEEAEALFTPRRSSKRAVYQALDQFQEAVAGIRGGRLRTQDWKARQLELQTTRERLREVRTLAGELTRRRSRLERVRRVRPLLARLDEAAAARAELLAAGEVPRLDPQAALRLAEAREALTLAEADLRRLQGELAEAGARLDTIRVDRDLLALAEEITRLEEHRLRCLDHRPTLARLELESAQELGRALDLARGLGWPAEGEEALRARLPGAPARARLARLLKDRLPLEQALEAAGARLAEEERRIQQAREELSQLGSWEADPALRAALEQAQRQGDLEAALAAAEGEEAGLARKLEEGLAGLGPWRRPAEALQAMAAPEPALVEELLTRRREGEGEAARLRAQRAAGEEELGRLELELEHLLDRFQPVSQEQVLQARRERDEAWRGILAAPHQLAAMAPAFERGLAEADRLADARLERAEHEADRQAREAALAHKRREQADLGRRLQAVEAELAAGQTRWEALASAGGLPELPLDLALSWLQRRREALELEARRATAGRRRADLQAAAAQLRERLWQGLGGAAQGGPAPALGECLRQAQERITRASQAEGRREALGGQIRAWEGGLPALREAREAAQARREGWARSWQEAAVAAGDRADAPVDRVEVELEVMQEIEQRLEGVRRRRVEQVEALQADLAALESSARALAGRVDPGLAGRPPEEIARELAGRLQEAAEAERDRAALQAQQGARQAKLEEARERQRAQQAGLAPIREAAGVEDLPGLERAIQRSDSLRAVEARLEAAREELAQQADGLPLEGLRLEVQELGPDELLAQLARCEAEEAEARAQLESLAGQEADQARGFAAMDGGDGAIQAEGRKQEVVAELAESAERYLQLQTASSLLRWSLERYREARQGPMLTRASAHFQRLTLRSFSRLLVDTGESPPRLLGIRPDGAQVGVDGMSEGTQDQLYLALRLAALEQQAAEGGCMPLVADDLFVNFDDERTAAGLGILGEISRGVQVLFLTHHEHLVPLAQEALGADLNVIRL